MRLKVIFISCLITVLVLSVIIVFIELTANQDESDYVTTFDYIDANTIKAESNDFVVIIISHNCPGRNTYMPQVRDVVEKIEAKNINYYIINDSPITKESDLQLTELLTKHQLNTKVYHFDKNIYKTNGGLINAKRRYYDFVLDLSPNVEELYLGYGYYIVFSDGKFSFDTNKYDDVFSYFDK